MPAATHESKTKLLNAVLNVIRAKGYAGTTIDDVCRGRRHQGQVLSPLQEQITRQRCFVLAKTQQDVKVAGESLAHLRRYRVDLFKTPGAASYSLCRSSTPNKSK